MTERTAVESLRQTVLGMVDVVSGAKALIANLVQKLSDALDSENTEADIRALRDNLEAAKGDLANAIVQNTPADRGPNAPDDAEVIPEGVDPLRTPEPAGHLVETGGADNAPAGEDAETQGLTDAAEDGSELADAPEFEDGSADETQRNVETPTGDSDDATSSGRFAS